MGRAPHKRALTVVDLFSGCGGLSLGAELSGFHSLTAVDVDATLQSAFRKNFPKTKAIQASVADLDPTAWRHLIGKSRPDGIIGGPPCQGFSRIGRRRTNDPRNNLIFHFFRQVKELRPKFFLMENVEGLLDEKYKKVLSSALQQIADQYTVLEPFVVSASDFGAPTTRRRVVIAGYDPREVDFFGVDDLTPGANPNLVTVRDAIADLPSPLTEPRVEESYEWVRYSQRRKKYSDYARALRLPPPSGLGWTEAIKLHKVGFISGLNLTQHSAKIARRYASIPGGKSDQITKSYRLQWLGQCPTLRAGTGPDKGSFQAVRPLHPGEGRVITVREAARLQGFPDWFVFHPTKWHSFRMIGNSVSPCVSRGLLKRLSKFVGS